MFQFNDYTKASNHLFMFYRNSRCNIFQQIAEHFKEDKKIAHNWKAEIQLRILVKHFVMYLLTGGVCCSGNLWPSSSNNLWKMMPLCQPHPPPTKRIGKIEEKTYQLWKKGKDPDTKWQIMTGNLINRSISPVWYNTRVLCIYMDSIINPFQDMGSKSSPRLVNDAL